MRRKFTLRDVLLSGLVVILVLVILYSGLRILESTVLFREEPEAPGTSKTIVRDGQEYFPRQDITVMMVLGIDRYGPVESSNYYRNEGSADSIMLIIFDETNAECTVLSLNRDTMVDMDMLGVQGAYVGTSYGQLALAHTYGSGLEDSCENVKNTLMRFLHGLTVDHYVSMNMDAIPILNDGVGGVTVTVTEDFSDVNPSIPMGEVTLRGEQAIDFVRTRKDVGDQKNVSRMARQREYVDGFLTALYEKEQADPNFSARLYEQIAPYIVTDCSSTTMSSMLGRYTDFRFNGIITPEGENRIVDGFYEFHVDEEKLDVLILKLFYSPK